MRKLDKFHIIRMNYSSRLSALLFIIVPLFGLGILLSCLDVIGRFPLTQDMSRQTAYLVFSGTLLLAFICYRIILSTIKHVTLAASHGDIIDAEITGRLKSKHSVSLTYKFTIDNTEYKNSESIAYAWFKSGYKKGEKISIYAYINDKNEAKATLKDFVA